MFISLSLTGFSPLGVVAMRVSLAAVILLFVVWIRRQCLPLDWRVWVRFLVFAVVGNLLPFYLISVGQLEVSSGMAGLLMAFMPLGTLLLAHYLLDDEQLNRYKLLGFLLGITGVAIVLWPSISAGSSRFVSSLLILCAALSYALNSVLVRRAPKQDVLVSSAGVMFVAAVLVMPAWLLLDQPNFDMISVSAWWSVIWMGLGPTALATLLFFVVIERAGPTFLSYINYFIPVVAYFTGVMVLDEALEFLSIAALGLIILGIIISRYQQA